MIKMMMCLGLMVWATSSVACSKDFAKERTDAAGDSRVVHKCPPRVLLRDIQPENSKKNGRVVKETLDTNNTKKEPNCKTSSIDSVLCN
jgi:hypothetical protein